ncbi:mevalonate kinase [Streptomyces sp. CS7]|uniref:mevalonate kinase n=1 Tax=Streptomyces sp. WT2 TaxID=1126599 RepID=G9HVW6_9ACTN|nr:mevalonate kinase [Streptomyces sp. CS-7]AEW22924.1 WT2.5 [Streptomyces sp. WT2]MCT6776421.1 mevalonate kinase [Streptomyces sp. CS-7]
MNFRQGELSTPAPPVPGAGTAESRRARSVGTGRAHAKCILLGEHAVVYGAPALALPVPQLSITASAGFSSRGGDPAGVSFTMTGSAWKQVGTQASEGLRRLTTDFRSSMGIDDGRHLDVIIDGSIPLGRGLGSSAACARAVVLALADLCGREVSQRTTFDLVQAAENVMHGKASGVDAVTVGASAPLLFQAGEARTLRVGCDALFVIADSGAVGSTKEAVDQLRERFRLHAGAEETFVRRASGLTREAVAALAAGRPEELGPLLTEYHGLLREAGLSTDRIEAMVRAALAAGSLGAKITGGGLGGCVLALTQPEQAREVTRRLHEAGAVQTWIVPLRRLVTHV